MNERNRKSHSRIVSECFLEIKNDTNAERAETIIRKYGRKTYAEALERFYEYKANEKGMTIEEYKEWVFGDDD